MANNNRFFQWIAGDKKGQVMVFDKIEQEDSEVYIVFKDGSRIKETLVAPINAQDVTGKFMAEIENYQNIWTFKDEWVGREEEKWEQNSDGERVCVQPLVPGRKVSRLIPPRYAHNRTSNFGVISNPEPVIKYIEVEKTIESKIDTTDPVYILMSKSKKVDSEISMNLTIALPPKNLYDIAKESFEKGNEKFIEYIVDAITTEEIKMALKEAIAQMYEKEYSINI